mgnify:FL=1|tara:strand:+ start:1284 stop:1733 length:450 start_codon:yes stop_codon:yes gene_type:complete
MKKFLLIFAVILTSCSYQPIYIKKSLQNVEFSKITIEGDPNISKKIINSLSLKENEFNDTLNDLLINSSYEIRETSKNTKGQVLSYRSIIVVNLVINNKKNTILNKKFLKDFSYPNKDNKFELVQYQNNVKNNLINKMIEDIILFINLQ